jgi:hypothetical protein
MTISAKFELLRIINKFTEQEASEFLALVRTCLELERLKIRMLDESRGGLRGETPSKGGPSKGGPSKGGDAA